MASHFPPPSRGKNVTHVSGTFCYLSVEPVTGSNSPTRYSTEGRDAGLDSTGPLKTKIDRANKCMVLRTTFNTTCARKNAEQAVGQVPHCAGRTRALHRKRSGLS